MSKNSLPSIEQFAAFLDGNLSQSEMRQFSQLAEHDSALHQLLDASDAVDDTIVGFTDVDLQLPLEISGSDFEIPDVDNVPDNFDFLSLAGDSFSDNEHLYQQEGMNVDHHHRESHSSLVDEIFDDLDNDGETMETDVDIDMDLSDNDIDNDLFDLDM